MVNREAAVSVGAAPAKRWAISTSGATRRRLAMISTVLGTQGQRGDHDRGYDGADLVIGWAGRARAGRPSVARSAIYSTY
jgi:hypothetical protein